MWLLSRGKLFSNAVPSVCRLVQMSQVYPIVAAGRYIAEIANALGWLCRSHRPYRWASFGFNAPPAPGAECALQQPGQTLDRTKATHFRLRMFLTFRARGVPAKWVAAVLRSPKANT